jgi:hypothetical protein
VRFSAPSNTFYIFVDGYSTNSGTFQLRVQANP